jgi:hypothetical protein
MYLMPNYPPQLPPLPPPRWAGIRSDWMNYVAASQKTPMSCWAACGEMIFSCWGVRRTQAEIVQRVYGAYVDWPGSAEAISASLSGSATNVAGRRVRIQHRFGLGPLPMGMLIRELNGNRPVLFVYNTGGDLDHAVVVTGVEYISTPSALLITKFAYRDPYPTPINLMRSGRVEKVGEEISQFLDSIQCHWLVSIS